MIKSPIILCGSGNSIPFLNSQYYRLRTGFPLKLEQIIKYNYSIGLNYFFRYGCDTTFTSFGDPDFYEDNSKELENVPLIIGCHSPQLKSHKHNRIHENTILLKKSNAYKGINSISEGVYSRQLIGIWALSLAISLGFKEIYLLGYDCCEINGQTHFYQGTININQSKPIYLKGKIVEIRLKFAGIGKKFHPKKKKEVYKTSTYERKDNLNNIWFKPFKNETNAKIYNVSPESAINVFEKIDYATFYSKIKNNHIDQNEAREEIKQIIKEKLNDL